MVWVVCEMEAHQAAAAITRRVPISLGSMRVFDDWFGRPMDNWHIAVGARAEDDTLFIAFNEGETLTIEGAEGIVFEPDAQAHRLTINRARRVRWTWYAYGRPKRPENLYVEEHWFEGNEIKASSTADWYTPVFKPSPTAPAVDFS